jgi:hypothetical protein
VPERQQQQDRVEQQVREYSLTGTPYSQFSAQTFVIAPIATHAPSSAVRRWNSSRPPSTSQQPPNSSYGFDACMNVPTIVIGHVSPISCVSRDSDSSPNWPP